MPITGHSDIISLWQKCSFGNFIPHYLLPPNHLNLFLSFAPILDNPFTTLESLTLTYLHIYWLESSILTLLVISIISVWNSAWLIFCWKVRGNNRTFLFGLQWYFLDLLTSKALKNWVYLLYISTSTSQVFALCIILMSRRFSLKWLQLLEKRFIVFYYWVPDQASEWENWCT